MVPNGVMATTTADGREAAVISGSVHPAPPIEDTYTANVSVVDHVFDPASGTFGVRLTLPNPGNLLPGGQRCKVTFDFPNPPPARTDR